MRVTIGKSGVLIHGAPATLRPQLDRWFSRGGRGLKDGPNGTLRLPQRKVWAFIAHYDPELDGQTRAWLDKQFSFEAIYRRISPHLRKYRGGYQALVTARGIANRVHGLFLDGGAGKTTIAAEISLLVGPTLLLCPPQIWSDAYVSSALAPDGKPEGDLLRWYSPIGRAPRKQWLRWGAGMDARNRDERLACLSVESDLYAVSSYTVGGVIAALLELPLACVIVDESDAAANPDTALARTLLEMRDEVPFRFVMCADPAPKNAGELWAQINFLDPEVLGPRKEFERKYGRRGRYGVDYDDHRKNEELLERIKEAGLVTMMPQGEFWKPRPAQRIIRVPLKLGPEQRRQYNAMRDDLALRIGKMRVVTKTSMARAMKLRQLTAGFIFSGRKAIPCGEQTKLKVLRRLLRTAAPRGVAGEQVVVWCHFVPEYRMVSDLLDSEGISHGLLAGKGRESIEARDDFKARRIRVLITHARTAGHGLRLHNCRNAIYMSLDYSPRSWRQSRLRIYRPPQRRECRFFVLIAEDTIDEEILLVLQGVQTWQQALRRILSTPSTPATPSNLTGVSA